MCQRQAGRDGAAPALPQGTNRILDWLVPDSEWNRGEAGLLRVSGAVLVRMHYCGALRATVRHHRKSTRDDTVDGAV